MSSVAADTDGLGREFLGVGWAFPVALTPDTGFIDRATYEIDIQQSIRIILLTAKGERVMRPDFGCGIHDLVFDALSAQLIASIKREVEDVLRVYEARINVRQVNVETGRLNEGRLDVVIDYQVRSTNQPGNYVFPFYFKESASR